MSERTSLPAASSARSATWARSSAIAFSFSAVISSRRPFRRRLGVGTSLGEDLVARVGGDLVRARDQGCRLLARLGHGRLALRTGQLAVASRRLRILQPLPDRGLPLFEQREDTLEQEPVQQIQEQQEVDDLEEQRAPVDAKRLEELHVSSASRRR